MCDLLIYRGPHWMDDSNAYTTAHLRIENNLLLTSSEIIQGKEELTDHYNNRYRKGDIVEVYPEGAITEKPSLNNKCVALRITGLDYETAKKYIEPLTEIDNRITNPLQSERRRIKRRRKFQLLWDDLPQVMKDQLRDERFLIVTKQKAIPYIKEHLNG